MMASLWPCLLFKFYLVGLGVISWTLSILVHLVAVLYIFRIRTDDVLVSLALPMMQRLRHFLLIRTDIVFMFL
jgi:hypothetical protein